MNIVDGIAYSDKQDSLITVESVRAMEDYNLWILFSTGESKVFDFTPLLEQGVFKALQNKNVFRDVYVDYGVPVWCNGEVDIAPEHLYYQGVSVQD